MRDSWYASCCSASHPLFTLLELKNDSLGLRFHQLIVHDLPGLAVLNPETLTRLDMKTNQQPRRGFPCKQDPSPSTTSCP